MFCRQCWEKVPEGTEVCPACGKLTAGTETEASAPPPSRFDMPTVQVVPSYLVPSIIVTVLCCLPAGVVAIVSAAQANSKQAVGDYAGALKAANRAKLWCWISFGVGLVVGGLYATLVLLGSSDTSNL